MEKKLLIYFGGNNPKRSKLNLPSWIPKSRLTFVQSINRINSDYSNKLNAFKSVIASETIEEILTLPNNNFSFEDQVHKTALEIKEKTKGSNVYLMYSGGIDSTSALVGIMNTWDEEDLKRVYILMSYRSILEFPEMWSVINQKFKGRIINSLVDTNIFLNEGYIITGELGDQLFGSDIILSLVDYYGEEGIHMPWKDNIKTFYSTIFSKNFDIDLFINMYSETCEYCPFEIKSCFDFLWWFNFTNKWQLVKYRVLSQSRFDNPKEQVSKIINFFDTPEFQRWSLDNHDLKIQKTLNSYKYTAKEYIVKHTKFVNYLNKPKIGSLQFVWGNFDRCYAFDENLNSMTMEEIIGCINNGK